MTTSAATLALISVLFLPQAGQPFPGRIFISYLNGMPREFINQFESSVGLPAPAQSFQRVSPPPDRFLEYQVEPGTEGFWIRALGAVGFIWKASLTSAAQMSEDRLKGDPVGPTLALNTFKVAVPPLPEGRGIHEGAADFCVSTEDLLGQPAPSVSQRLAGVELGRHGTLHDLLIGYVRSVFTAKGADIQVEDHPLRMVFRIGHLKSEVLHGGQWEKLELQVFSLEPSPFGHSGCVQMSLLLIGRYAAATSSPPGDGFFHPMDSLPGNVEENYVNEFGTRLQNYLRGRAQ